MRCFMEKNNWFKIIKLSFISSLIFTFAQVSYAAEKTVKKLELSAIASLTNAALENDEWHAILPVLGSKNNYYIATSDGKIYQLNDNEVSQSPFFELKIALNNPDIIALTAITLDPSFSYRDRDGYHTFYTAHTEPSKPIKQKLTPINAEISVPYDTVLTRWHITYIPNHAPKVRKQNEVLRIAIQRPQENIKQLSFNPYIEPWHDDFGLLFIALAKSEGIQNQALYAGSILSIRPKKYGLRNYSIPTSNPFIKTASIENEIVYISGQNTTHFNWIKKNNQSLLIQLDQQGENVLIRAEIGDDWRKSIPQEKIIKRLPPTNSTHNTLLYHGRELKDLWGRFLHLQAAGNAWQLQASTLTSPLNNVEVSEGESHPHLLINYNADEEAKFSLYQRHNGELLLLEHNNQRLYVVKAPEVAVDNPLQDDPPSSISNAYSTLALLFVFIIILIGSFWYLRKRLLTKKNLLSEQWLSFEINSTTQSLSLHKRHPEALEKIIKISSLISSELLLNDNVISTVSADISAAFSNAREEAVRMIFAKEHRLKMLDGKQRKVQLRLVDDQNTSYIVGLYFRVGNIRHTKLKYSKMINKVIDWQWLFSQYINQEVTTKRKIKVQPKQEEPVNHTAIPTTVSPKEPDESLKQEQITSNQHIVQTGEADTHLSVPSTNESQSIDTKTIDLDTEFVTALDKLIMMKKQGFLNETEFNIAKTKILKNLAND